MPSRTCATSTDCPPAAGVAVDVLIDPVVSGEGCEETAGGAEADPPDAVLAGCALAGAAGAALAGGASPWWPKTLDMMVPNKLMDVSFCVNARRVRAASGAVM